ncbi:DUF1579 domain-containing protein [Luteimonas sp. A649]
MNTATRIHARRCLAIALACAMPIALAAEPAPQTGTAQARQGTMSAEQQAMMDAWTRAATPGAEHAQLAEHFAGSWDVAMSIWMEPDAPPVSQRGTATISPVLGGRQLRQDFKGTFMGAPFEGTGMSGYDNVRERYTSSWTDNMSTSHMLTDGDYDEATRTYTFTGEMADPMHPGTMIPVRETVRVVDADHHVMEMFEPKDGKEVRTMQLEYTRVK